MCGVKEESFFFKVFLCESPFVFSLPDSLRDISKGQVDYQISVTLEGKYAVAMFLIREQNNV